MFTMLTVLRKKPEISTEEFRRFMEVEYGPTYVNLPQTKEYVQYFLSDVLADSTEPPIDAIVRISFESREEMQKALQAQSYKDAHELRKAYLRETSVGIHSAVLDQELRFV
jgi:hypothetical protein